MKNQNIQRRDFLKNLGITGLGLAIGFNTNAANSLTINKIDAAIVNLEINPFIIIDTAGNITIVNPRPDMGQGSTQAAPSLIAEELEVSLDKVKLLQSNGQEKYGSQQSGGSSTVRELWLPLRRAGAAAKEMLIEVAANRWKVSPDKCYAADAKVYLKDSSSSFGYGELADDAAKLPVPANPKLKQPAEFKIIGKYNKRLDVPDRVTGKAVYGIDIDVPNMVYACMCHSPSIHAKLTSFDDSAAKKIPGVLQVIKAVRKMPHRTSDAVAVIASNWWAAQSGRKALILNWEVSEANKSMSTDRYFNELAEASKVPGVRHEEKGDFDLKFANAAQKLEVNYETPFLAHAPIEPECAVAHLKEDGTAEVWAHVQGPDGALGDIASVLGIAKDKIKLNVPLLGGSFGRKAYHDYLNEACYLTKVLNKPVKVIWTREDDIAQGPYRPGMLSHMQGFVKSGKITGFHHHAIGESILGQVYNGYNKEESEPWLSGEISASNHQYNFGSAEKVSYSRVKTDIPIVWWRSVYASNFGWGQECFIDELAHLAGKDPLQARLAILEDERFKKVLNVLAEKAKYNDNSPGSAKGIAIFKSFDSISAACVTVSKSAQGIKIDKVVSVIDCGYYVNPDNVKAQTEGNIVMGISAAVKVGITFTNGVCDQSNFHNYNVMRINEAPKMEIHIIDSGEKPGGVGEPGLPPIAPALGNAIFNLTGKRIRKLPFNLDAV